MRIKLLTIIAVLLVALTAPAQRRVMRMGGQNIDVDELTKDWPKLARPAGATDDAMTAAVAAYVDALGTRGIFSGTIVLAKNGKPLLERAYGLANRDHGVKNAVDTKYNVAGISKLFTDLAIYQLEEQGKLTLTDTLRKHLPDYPNAIADRITIADLMAHRSGMADFVGPEFDAMPKDRLRELRDFLPLFANKPAETTARVPYSNAGYIVLGLVVEKLSGMSYADYVKTRIFAPAGMTGSGNFDLDAAVPNRAVGYTMRNGAWERNTHVQPARGTSSGESYATAGDLVRFVEALRGAKLVNKAASARLLGAGDQSRGTSEGGGAVRVISPWSGGLPGCSVSVAPIGDLTFVVLSNYDPPAAGVVADNFRAAFGGQS